MEKFNCFCTIITGNGSKSNKTQDVKITVSASGLYEARIAARTQLKEKYKKLSGIAIRKVEVCRF